MRLNWMRFSMMTDNLSTRAARLLEEAERNSAACKDDYCTRAGIWAKLARTLLAELTASEAELTVVRKLTTNIQADNVSLREKLNAAEAERDLAVRKAADNMAERERLYARATELEAQLTAAREALRQLVDQWRGYADSAA